MHGASNPSQYPMDAYLEGSMTRLDSYRFEAVPGPLFDWNVEYLGQ